MYVDQKFDVKVIRGKLLLHGLLKTSFTLSAPQKCTLTRERHCIRLLPSELLCFLDNCVQIGCGHTRSTLPALILEAFQYLAGSYRSYKARSMDLLYCDNCATDLRIKVDINADYTCFEVEVEMWHSFDGRDSNNRDKAEDGHFEFYSGNRSSGTTMLPDCNLVAKFGEGSVGGGNEGDGDKGEWIDLTSWRRSCLQWWSWSYSFIKHQLHRYVVPGKDGEGEDRVKPCRPPKRQRSLLTSSSPMRCVCELS